MNRNFTQVRVFKMSRVDVRHAERPASNNEPAVPGKCIRWYVQTAVSKLRFLLNRAVTVRYIAVIVSKPKDKLGILKQLSIF